MPFSASWGGATVFTVNSGDNFNYTDEIIADVTASTSSTILDFSQSNEKGNYNLDDVSVTDVTPAGIPDGGSNSLAAEPRPRPPRSPSSRSEKQPAEVIASAAGWMVRRDEGE